MSNDGASRRPPTSPGRRQATGFRPPPPPEPPEQPPSRNKRGLFSRIAGAGRWVGRALGGLLSSRPARIVATLGLLAAVVGGAGSGLFTTDSGTAGAARMGVLGTQGAGAATAGNGGAGQPLPAKVETHHPDLVVDRAPVKNRLGQVRRVGGVAHAAAAARFKADLPTGAESWTAVESAGTGRTVEVLAVSPREFRPLTPDVTAQNAAVWQRLLAGDMVVRHDIAQKLNLELGRSYALHGPDGVERVRVGAFASNGAPPFAEVLVPWSVAGSLGVRSPNTVVAAVGGQTSARAAGEAITKRLGGGKLALRYLPRKQQAELEGAARSHVPSFSYRDRGDGTIAMDSDWVNEWIVTVNLPHLGTARCNRVMVPQLLAALQEIEAAGLADELDPEQFGGCWSPRHVLFNPNRSLSTHAWGLAIDINTATNGYGATPQLDRRIVELFERWGFKWGGDWSVPDGMHFQLERIVRPDGG